MGPTSALRKSDSPALRAAQQWLGLAFVALVLAGLFALAVVVGRMPPFDRFVTDPLFFKRCLVAHVNLALVVWFYSFIAALLWMLPGRTCAGWLPRRSVHLAGSGVVLMLVGAGLPESQPVLSNYVPTIDHWVFQLGQLVFAGGVVASLLDRRTFSSARARSEREGWIPDAAQPGLHATAFALLLAAITFGISWAVMPSGLSLDVYSELLVWGGGHVLQLVCVLGMIASWLVLLEPALGRAPVSRPAASALFLALLLPWTLAPVLALQGSWTSAYRVGFTELMQWCIAPVVSIFIVLCGGALASAWREGRIGRRELTSPAITGFIVSALLTVTGFGLGAAIRGSNTIVPAHYHASVGAVTVTFMTVAYALLQCFRMSIPTRALRRASAWQPLLYGSGMLLFAAGFTLAGAHGMGRKVYGAEQAARGLAETLGLGLMGVGGFVSIAGGLLFLLIVGSAWRLRAQPTVGRRSTLGNLSWR